ncbi:MAG: putative DNA binding domain-containing protein [Hydrogenophaga sp.]|nr:RNA-binding domain-containing protein [Hydrogenophaga sp.]MDP3348214.1 putative DNA binding domain-containing protein [Hydrogenophaga sp.]MDZ4283921.1 putative DNA binding domain-containing protein [Hydrogenophaga sp.]
MSLEDHQTDCKSLRTVSGKTADWTALAQDTVCFANGAGGRLLIGIEDGQALPPPDQRVDPNCWTGCASASANSRSMCKPCPACNARPMAASSSSC